MKKKIFLLCSVISLLLVAFPVSVCAEETAPTNTSGSEGAVIPLLDSYFYDNYDILPYIESNGSQYINTGVSYNDNLSVEILFSNVISSSSESTIFGSALSGSPNSYFSLSCSTDSSDDESVRNRFRFNTSSYYFNYLYDSYVIQRFLFSDKSIYVNGSLLNTFTNPSPSFNLNIYLFALNVNGNSVNGYSSYRLYKCSMYDSSLDANDEPIGYVRYYYPAKAKTSGTIGLYDAVSKSFFPSLGSEPFSNPTDDKVLNFQISEFLTSGLGWIGDIFDFVLETPILLFFMAIGLAGVAFRWTKRILHF